MHTRVSMRTRQAGTWGEAVGTLMMCGLDMQQEHPMGTPVWLHIGTADRSPFWARAWILSLPRAMCTTQHSHKA